MNGEKSISERRQQVVYKRLGLCERAVLLSTEPRRYFSSKMHYSSHDREFKTDVDVIKELRGVLKTIATTVYSIGSVHSVVVTHVNGPKSFYVRPAAFTHSLDFLQCRRTRLNPSEAQLGSIIVYYSQVRFVYVRGQIRFIKQEEGRSYYDMFAIDYGWIDKDVPIHQMFKPYFNLQVPSLVRHCKLESWEGVRVRNHASFRDMRILLGEEKPIKMVVKAPDPFILTVALRNRSSPPGMDKVVILMDSQSLEF